MSSCQGGGIVHSFYRARHASMSGGHNQSSIDWAFANTTMRGVTIVPAGVTDFRQMVSSTGLSVQMLCCMLGWCARCLLYARLENGLFKFPLHVFEDVRRDITIFFPSPKPLPQLLPAVVVVRVL